LANLLLVHLIFTKKIIEKKIELKNYFLSFIIPLMLLVYSKAHAQLGNYWTLQVSTEGTLLSGALVAANNNTAGFFYNPASMSSDSTSSFSFNTSLFRSYFLSYKNPFGEGTKLEDLPGSFDPIFLSYLVPRKNKLNVKLGVSLMGKQNTNYKILDRIYLNDYSFPSVDSISGDYGGQYNYILKSSEYWINFSFSRQFNKVFSLGGTIILAYRYLNYINEVNSNYVFKNSLNQNSTSSYQNSTEAYMYNYKILGKIGMIFNLNENSRIGINLTTSSANIYGRGSILRTTSQSNVLALTLDTSIADANDQFISDFGSGLKADYKSPFSISLGYNLEKERYKFGFAIEFFNQIKAYNVIQGEALGTLINSANPNVSEEEFLSLSFGQRSIVNVAISYEKVLNDKFTILTGFRTNYSTTRNVDYTGIQNLNHIEDIAVDFYHFTGGTTFTFLRNEFIGGIDLGLSFQNNQPNIINYSNPLVINNQGLPLQGNDQFNTKITDIMLGLVLGYSFSF
jgi:hypothetical protein